MSEVSHPGLGCPGSGELPESPPNPPPNPPSRAADAVLRWADVTIRPPGKPATPPTPSSSPTSANGTAPAESDEQSAPPNGTASAASTEPSASPAQATPVTPPTPSSPTSPSPSSPTSPSPSSSTSANGTAPADSTEPSTPPDPADTADRADPPPPADAPTAVGEPPERRRRRLRSLRTFDSLRDHRFRRYFVAMLGSMSSQNMQMVVRAYLAFDLTGSYAALGVISLANAIPGLALSVVGGALADRVPYRKWVVQAGQFANALAALAIAVLAWAGVLAFSHLLISAIFLGASMALMMPARQALLPALVGPDLLTNAVALNSAGMNVARLVAPAVGGFLLAWAGAGWVYFLMCGLFLLASAFLTRVPEQRREVQRATSFGGEALAAVKNIKEGGVYIWKHQVMGPLLAINIVIVLLSMPYMFLLAGFVQDVLNRGADSVGILQSMIGVGSLVGALVVASVAWRRRGLMFFVGSAFQGVLLALAFWLSSSVWMMAIFMLVMGLGESVRQSLSMVLVQHYVDDEFRGRVMSIYMLQFSLAQLGAFLVGVLAEALGPRVALAGTSALLVVVSLLAIVFMPRLRPLR